MDQARIIRLSEGQTGKVRFLSGLHVTLEDGKTQSWVTVTRVGSFSDPRYGKFEITRDMLLSMVENFDKRTYGQDIFIDVAHRPDNGAAGKVVKLAVEGDRLRALVEWTPYGIDAVKNKGYVYLSAEYHENFRDNESGNAHGPVLVGAGLTVRPVIKRLDPVRLSCDSDSCPTLIHPELEKTLSEEIQIMWKQLSEKLKAKLAAIVALSAPVVDQLVSAFETAVKPVTDEAAAVALMEAFADSGKKLAEQVGDKVVQLSIQVPDFKAGITAEDVARILAESQAASAAAAKQLADKKDANLKLLSDTINAAAGLEDDAKKALSAEVADLITPEMTETQIKALAATQIKHGNEVAAAKKLSAMGYLFPSGTVHITVDSSNEAKALQEGNR